MIKDKDAIKYFINDRYEQEVKARDDFRKKLITELSLNNKIERIIEQINIFIKPRRKEEKYLKEYKIF